MSAMSRRRSRIVAAHSARARIATAEHSQCFSAFIEDRCLPLAVIGPDVRSHVRVRRMLACFAVRPCGDCRYCRHFDCVHIPLVSLKPFLIFSLRAALGSRGMPRTLSAFSKPHRGGVHAEFA